MPPSYLILSARKSWLMRDRRLQNSRYLAPRSAVLFCNQLCVDGGLMLFMPPTSVARTIRVCAFPADSLGLEDIGISPDCNPENRASPREVNDENKSALGPLVGRSSMYFDVNETTLIL